MTTLPPIGLTLKLIPNKWSNQNKGKMTVSKEFHTTKQWHRSNKKQDLVYSSTVLLFQRSYTPSQLVADVRNSKILKWIWGFPG